MLPSVPCVNAKAVMMDHRSGATRILCEPRTRFSRGSLGVAAHDFRPRVGHAAHDVDFGLVGNPRIFDHFWIYGSRNDGYALPKL